MDFYFTDRKFNLIEIASTDGQAPYQLSTAPDFQSVKAAARTLSGTLIFTREQANRINQMAALGNYVLYHDKFGKDRFMTIMDIRHDPLNGTHDFTAEDAGVDLINETVGAYTADKAYNIAYYINKFTYDSGFEIGTNEISTLSRKLKWDSTDETSLARILSVATQFDAELDFSFEISGTNVVKRYINIYKHRGADNQVRLYLDKDINNIVTTGDIYDLYTSVYATGGTPEGSDKPITLKGYKWTDPDGRYELGADGILRDTVAVQLWSRILSNDNPNPTKHHLQRSKSYEASTQASLLQSALGGLKKAVNPAVNYEVDIAVLPENIEIGDTVHIVDDNEDLYLSARVLELKYDYALEQYTATLGDYLIEVSTVDEKLKELADNLKEMPKAIQYYPWVRYADDADGNGFSMFPQDKAYMAVIYGKTSTPSDNPSDYAGKWQRVVGPNGQDGADGIVGPAGEDGQTSYFHRAYANSLDGKTDFSVTDGNGKSYMGTYSDFIKADSTDPTKYNWALFKGDKGDNGTDGVAGKDGIGIKSTAITYALGDSGTTTPATGWTTSVPSLVKGKYLWTKTVWLYTDNTSESGYSTTYIGKDGNDGNNGLAGKDGVGISATKVEYVGSTSGTTKPTSGWLTTVPSVAAGNFLWTRTTWSYTDGTSESGYSVAKMGEKGDQGIKGPVGADGKSSYTHIAYANSSDSERNMNNWVLSDPAKEAAKIAYKDGTNIIDYKGVGNWENFGMPIKAKKGTKFSFTFSWSQPATSGYFSVYLSEDKNGASGSGKPAGVKKLDLAATAQTNKLYTIEDTAITDTMYLVFTGGSVTDGVQYQFKLSIQQDFSQDPNNHEYMGWYSDFMATDSNDPSQYGWILIKGEDGSDGTPGKAGVDGRTPYFHQAWADSQDGKTNFSTTVSLGKKYLGTYTDFISADSTDPTKYRWTELVGAMEVGGENLIRNGNFINQTSTHWRDWNGATGATREISKPGTDWPANTGGVIHLVNPNGGQWGYAQDNIKVAKGGTYTISVVVTGTQGTKVALQHGNGGTDAWQAKEIVKPTSGMDTLSYTFKVGNDAETTNIYVGFGQNGKGTVWMSRITLQKGNVATDWEPAPGDTDEKIDAIIPPPSSGISYPSNPKKGQQHWLTDANGKPKGLFQYDGTEWVAVPVNADTISANTLNGMTINGVTINGSTINSPNINVPFNNVPTNPDEPEGSPFATFVSGTTKLTSNLNISGNITDGTNKTPQWVKTLVSPQGFSNIISTPDASKALSVVEISLGAMFLSEWHSDVTANDGFVSSYLKAGDATTYERKDVIKDTANFKDAVIRYSRKGTQVNVGFAFTLLSETGWVGLSTIPKGYTPASLASVGITCPSLSFQGYFCVVYPNGSGWRLIPNKGQGKGGFQGTVSYVTYDDYPYNDAVH